MALSMSKRQYDFRNACSIVSKLDFFYVVCKITSPIVPYIRYILPWYTTIMYVNNCMSTIIANEIFLTIDYFYQAT